MHYGRPLSEQVALWIRNSLHVLLQGSSHRRLLPLHPSHLLILAARRVLRRLLRSLFERVLVERLTLRRHLTPLPWWLLLAHLRLRWHSERKRIPHRPARRHHVLLEVLVLRHELTWIVDLLMDVMELALCLSLRRLPRSSLASVLVLFCMHLHLLFVLLLVH